jgi:hypothetical protein
MTSNERQGSQNYIFRNKTKKKEGSVNLYQSQVSKDQNKETHLLTLKLNSLKSIKKKTINVTLIQFWSEEKSQKHSKTK